MQNMYIVVGVHLFRRKWTKSNFKLYLSHVQLSLAMEKRTEAPKSELTVSAAAIAFTHSLTSIGK